MKGKLKIGQLQKEEKQLTEMDSLKKLGIMSLMNTVSTVKSG